MRKSLNVATLFILICALTGAAIAAEPADSKSTAGVVNINTADVTQLAFLPRIGPSAAAKIIEYRTTNGAFKKASDLMQVKGIGEKTFDLIAPYLVVDGKTTLSEPQSAPRKPRAAKAPKTPKSRPEASSQAQ